MVRDWAAFNASRVSTLSQGGIKLIHGENVSVNPNLDNGSSDYIV
jgi:hypothetical protein